MTAYFIFKEDIDSLTNGFAKFNSTYSDLKKAFKEVTGEQLNIGDSAVEKSSKALQLNLAEDLTRHETIKIFFICKFNLHWKFRIKLNEDVASFLERLNLKELTDIFEEQEFDMDDVLNLSNEELKDIGVNKLKHRKLIMQETQKMRKGSSSLAASAKEKVSEITVTMHVLLRRYSNILSKHDGTADS